MYLMDQKQARIITYFLYEKEAEEIMDKNFSLKCIESLSILKQIEKIKENKNKISI